MNVDPCVFATKRVVSGLGKKDGGDVSDHVDPLPNPCLFRFEAFQQKLHIH